MAQEAFQTRSGTTWYRGAFELSYEPAEVLGHFPPRNAMFPNVKFDFNIPSGFGRAFEIEPIENEPAIPASAVKASADFDVDEKAEAVKKLVERPMGGVRVGTPCYLCGDGRRPVVKVRSCGLLVCEACALLHLV